MTVSTFALMLAVGVGGCAKKDDPSVATANPGAKTGSSTPATGQESGLKYSQCMRDQGMSWFPDPGSDGGLKVSVPEGTDQAKLDKAEATCKPYLPGGNGAGPGMSEADIAKMRQMAQCIRDKGFAKYPDPDANGSIHIDEDVTGIKPDDPAFQKAMQECQKYLPPKKGQS